MTASDLLWVAPLVFGLLVVAWLMLLGITDILTAIFKRPPWDQ